MNRNVLITGASSEIGRAIADVFAASDDTLILHCNKNAATLSTYNTKVVSSDFSDEEQLLQFIAEIKDIDVFINAAAITKTDLLVTLTDQDIKNMIQVNTIAPVKICRAIIPQMLVKRKGCIVSVSSIAASRGNRGQTVYGGTKGFIESFTRSLASEFGSKGIRVNAVAPGAIDAGSLKDLLVMAPDEVKKSISLNRLGTPKDVASTVHYLCSDEASFITGQIIHIDGGFNRGI